MRKVDSKLGLGASEHGGEGGVYRAGSAGGAAGGEERLDATGDLLVRHHGVGKAGEGKLNLLELLEKEFDSISLFLPSLYLSPIYLSLSLSFASFPFLSVYLSPNVSFSLFAWVGCRVWYAVRDPEDFDGFTPEVRM